MQTLFSIFSIFVFTAQISAQNQTALNIVCDTPEIPIYVNGHLVGTTPLEHNVAVFSGWHRVSFFPNVDDSDIETQKVFRDILKLGTQDVLVESGQVVHVSMSYSSLGQDIDGYYNSVRTGNYFGFSMIIVLISIWVWAYV